MSSYESKQGFITSIWGPPLWFSLHTMSFNFPMNPTKEEKIQYYDFFKNLGNILPCGACRNNYKLNLKQLKFSKKHFKNRDMLSRFVYDLHELVNCKLGKNSNLSFNQIRDRYELFRATCSVIDETCINPKNGIIKSKCILNIIPYTSKRETLSINKKCLPKI